MEEYERLIIENEALVYHVLKQMHLYSQLEDYYDVGMIGLCKAAKTFDNHKGSKFSTYACICIRNTILMDIRDQKRQCDYYSISLQTPINYDGDGNEQILENTISDYELEIDILNKEEKIALIESIRKLNDEDRQMIDLYFWKEMTQKEIARYLKMSQANVSRRIQRALNNLRKGGLLSV